MLDVRVKNLRSMRCTRITTFGRPVKLDVKTRENNKQFKIDEQFKNIQLCDLKRLRTFSCRITIVLVLSQS